MTKIWLRMELFELGILQLPSKYSSKLTLPNIKKALELLQAKSNEENTTRMETEEPMDDATMHSPRALSAATNAASHPERAKTNTLSFSTWLTAFSQVFAWREQDFKAFWLLLVNFHRQIPVLASEVVATTTGSPCLALDEEHCLLSEEIPYFKIAIFLFVQSVRPHSLKSRHALESFNAVWRREEGGFGGSNGHDPSSTASGTAATTAAAAGSTSPSATSPPPPSSPHTLGMQDRSTSDAYYMNYVRDHLDTLLELLFPEVQFREIATNDDTVGTRLLLAASELDLLDFLMCAGETKSQRLERLSQAYSKWTLNDELSIKEESGSVLCQFVKSHLCLNQKLYPPVGFSLAAAASLTSRMEEVEQANRSRLRDGDDDELMESQEERLARELQQVGDVAKLPTELTEPIIISSCFRTTVLKREEDLPRAPKLPDLVIFACHDTFVYVLGPLRHVMVIACNNCRILTAPNTGVFFVDRCENVQVTCVASLVRINNCLDSRVNAFTLNPLILNGENVGVCFGPYNAKYPALGQQMAEVRFVFEPNSVGAWDRYLNLENEDKQDEKSRIALQSPASFTEIYVPVKMQATSATSATTAGTSAKGPGLHANNGHGDRPFLIPFDYQKALEHQVETVETLRRLVCSEEFNLAKKRGMETVIQTRFKEWLSTTGNARQILDLVQIERARNTAAK